MKPKPFSSLNHLTVPFGMWSRPPWIEVLLPRRTCPGAGTCVSPPDARAALRPGKVQDVEDPMSIRRDVKLPLREITLRTSRSSGPGGQHANVTASRVEAVFDVEASDALTDEQKRRVIARLGPRVTAVAQDARGQARNRELALQRLQRRLAGALQVAPPRTRTRPSRAAIARQ